MINSVIVTARKATRREVALRDARWILRKLVAMMIPELSLDEVTLLAGAVKDLTALLALLKKNVVRDHPEQQ